MNIVLTGFMASGKSTVGKRLAELLNYVFADTDTIIENKEKTAISNIFENHGEAYFRKLEKNAVLEVSKADRLVIATGGGVVLDKENIDNLRKNGVIINLCPDADVIKARLLGDSSRPLVKDSDFSEIMERFDKRRPFYDNCDYRIAVSTGMDADCICKKIMELVKR